MLELGKRLVSQLDASDDFLASWMAHHVAQRIKDAEESPKEGRAAATEACAKAILELWEHRSALPDQARPLRDLDPVMRTLASLDVDQTRFRYHPELLREVEMAAADEGAKKWLELAIGLDHSARLLIQFVLRAAAQEATARAKPWVELAASAGANDYAERSVVKFILDTDDETRESASESALRDRLVRLESFVGLAKVVIGEIRAQLRADDGQGA